MRFWKTCNCLYLPNEALSKSLKPRRKKSSLTWDLTWATLISLLNVATRPKSMIFLGGEVVYYFNCCHSSQCFHVIVLFSSDMTPLIHVPDLQTQAFQTGENVLERLKKSTGEASPALQAESSCFQPLHREVGASGAYLGTSRTRPWRILTSPTVSCLLHPHIWPQNWDPLIKAN